MTDDIQIVSGRELRRDYEEGVPIRLPLSGQWVRVRSVEPDALLNMERIPELLTPIIADLMETGEWRNDDMQTPESLRQWRELVNAIASCALVSPKVVIKPADKLADDEILIEHLKWFDRLHLVQAIHRPLEELAGFRGEQEGDVESVGDAGEPAPARKPDTQSKSMGTKKAPA